MTRPSKKPFQVTPELQLAWDEAEAALLRFAASRDTVDRERALAKLYAVCLQEAPAIIRYKAKVDQKLPADQRRDLSTMAADAAQSVLFHKRKRDDASGLTILSNVYDPAEAPLRQLVTLWLYRKVMDYVRRESIEGVTGRAPGAQGDGPAQRTPSVLAFAQSLSVRPAGETLPGSVLSGSVIPGPASTVEPVAGDGLVPTSAQASGSHLPDEDQAVDAHQSLMELTAEFKRHLPPDQAEIFECEFHELTNEEGLAFVNERHGPRQGPDGKWHPHMSLATYKRKLKLARETLAALYGDDA